MADDVWGHRPIANAKVTDTDDAVSEWQRIHFFAIHTPYSMVCNGNWTEWSPIYFENAKSLKPPIPHVQKLCALP